MHIIDTVRKAKPVVLVLTFCVFHFLVGCIQQNNLQRAQDYVTYSEEYYQRAVATYRDLIKNGKDLKRFYFELGRLYYEHGKFKEAIEALQETDELEAKKFLAISHYRLGDFTDALEIFNQYQIPDDEYLYYHGLTCEELNLFDKALEIYNKINAPDFKAKAAEHIKEIEKETKQLYIQELDPEINNILINAPSPAEYPQAGALILFSDEKIEISADNKQVTTLHYMIKVLNERGKESFAETGIDYDSTYEKVELEFARVIKPDGRVIEVGSRHIRDVSKYLNFPLYSNARVYIISFPEISEDATIEYKVKIYRNQLINKKDFVLSYGVQSSEPIIKADFSLSLPKDKPLQIKTINEQYNNFGANLKPEIEEEKDYLIYRWHFKNIPQIIPESNMPGYAEINPTLFFSTFNNWQEIYDWWWLLAKDKINPDAAIKDKIEELTKDIDAEEAKIRAIYNFCAKEIRYVAVEYGEAGYEPHQAEDIFRNKYGDCKDQAILLVTMLKEAGFSAWPVLIATKEYYNLNQDFPAALFNHCIAAVAVKEDSIVFLDPTAETCYFNDLPAGDQQRRVLIFQEDGYKIAETPLYPAEHNLTKQETKIKLNPDETINVERNIFTYGIYDQSQRFWLLYTLPELIEVALREKIQGFSIGAKLNNYQIKNLDNLNEPIVLSYSFFGPEYFTQAGNLRIMPQLAGLDASMVAQDERKYPLDFNVLDIHETILEIEIPDNFAVKYIPETVTKETPWLNFIAEYNQENNKIYFKQKTDLKKNKISESEYPQFKEFFEGLARQIKQRIVLERIK